MGELYVLIHTDSKLGVPIKTTVSATVLEEALNGMVTIRPLPLGQPVSKKVRSPFSSFVQKLYIQLYGKTLLYVTFQC